MKRIVEDLLWLARFDSAPPRPRGHRRGNDRRRMRPALQGSPGARSLHLQLERVGTGPPMIVAPADRIDRLAAVLVDNACKYAGKAGCVRIEVGRVGPPPSSSRSRTRDLGSPRRSERSCSIGSGAAPTRQVVTGLASRSLIRFSLHRRTLANRTQCRPRQCAAWRSPGPATRAFRLTTPEDQAAPQPQAASGSGLAKRR